MLKLFVAVDLSADATAELTLLQPPRTRGVRLARPGQMHLTLHYLGKAGVERMAAALEAVEVPAFSLAFEGVGRFPSASGAVTLWAGVAESAALRELHAATAAALAGEGFQPEVRPYTPHVSLGRCGLQVPTRVVDEFLARNQGFCLAAIPITRFSLYSSSFVGDAPVYRRERSFQLLIAEGDAEGSHAGNL
jgi:2'-5' RNA ligase